jgi:hypothetical protein
MENKWGGHGHDRHGFFTIYGNVLTVGESVAVKSKLVSLILTQEGS